MEAFEQNNRDFVQATALMLLVTGLVILAGVVLFPLTAYDDPSASYGNLPALVGTRTGSIIVFLLFGILAANMAVFLSRVTRLEQVRNTLQARAISNGRLDGSREQQLPPPR